MRQTKNHKITLQLRSKRFFAPKLSQFKKWLATALPTNKKIELTIRIVNNKESCELNQKYRHKNHATNVLSFPYVNIFSAQSLCHRKPKCEGYIGDLVMCAPVITKEAQQQQKEILAHWAHLTIHGILHLSGYEHDSKQKARLMEIREIRILKKLNIANPY